MNKAKHESEVIEGVAAPVKEPQARDVEGAEVDQHPTPAPNIMTDNHHPAPLPVDADGSQTSMLATIERLVASNAPTDTLEKMLSLQERIWEREERKAFDRAFAAAKGEIPVIAKDGRVNFKSKDSSKPDTDYSHETLSGIARVVDPILASHGLSYRFRTESLPEGRLRVTCVLAHSEGYSEEVSLEGARDTSGSKNDFQALGSTATYLQRYTLKLILGLSAGKDDDASKIQAAGKENIDGEQYQNLTALMEQAEADETRLLKFLQVDELIQLPAEKYGAAEKMLRQKIKDNEEKAETNEH